MIDCPKCGAHVDGPWCKVCGEGKPTQATHAPADPFRYLCHYVDRGQRCGNLGTYSPNTAGDPKGGPHPGPWYCPQHIPGSVRDSGKRTPEGAQKLREILSHLRDPEARAEREAIQSEGL